jgi:hypothetical protein
MLHIWTMSKMKIYRRISIAIHPSDTREVGLFKSSLPPNISCSTRKAR